MEANPPPKETVVVPAGPFSMGTGHVEQRSARALDPRIQAIQLSEERPQHEVLLDAFEVEVVPVTVAQYRAFCEATGIKLPKPPRWGWVDDHPIVKVTWFEAVDYCEWVGGRLPTEAEWEKAAGGDDARIFPWGNEWTESAAHCSYRHQGECLDQTAPVGTHPAGISPYGCHDMLGNVWEWCWDWADPDYYRHSPRENPRGPKLGWNRILRGGSWKCNWIEDLRIADQSWSDPGARDETIGFRCARDVAGSAADSTAASS